MRPEGRAGRGLRKRTGTCKTGFFHQSQVYVNTSDCATSTVGGVQERYVRPKLARYRWGLLIRTNKSPKIPDFPVSASSRWRQQIVTSLFSSSLPFSSSSSAHPKCFLSFGGLISQQKVLSGKSLGQRSVAVIDGGRGALPPSGLLISEL